MIKDHPAALEGDFVVEGGSGGSVPIPGLKRQAGGSRLERADLPRIIEECASVTLGRIPTAMRPPSRGGKGSMLNGARTTLSNSAFLRFSASRLKGS